MKVIRWFIKINWRCSSWLKETFPVLFSDGIDCNDFLQESIRSELLTHKLTKPSILEVGGIDRPLLGKSSEYHYDGLDISYSPKCDEAYDRFFVQSVEESINHNYDIVFSTTVLEHVPSNQKSIFSMYKALNSGGYCTLYSK